MKSKLLIALLCAAGINLSASAAQTHTALINGYELNDILDADQTDQPDQNKLTDQIIDYAHTLVGKPYVWGATGPRAYDCSGFTRHVFSNFGINLPRTSRTQYTQGEPVKKDEIQPGDLLFFSGRSAGKTVGHVAIATEVDPDSGKTSFIHSATSKGVSTEVLEDSQYFSRRFLGARRILPD